MRDFFKEELKTLKAKTGLNQYENISSLPDAQFQFKILLDSLVLACNEFAYIPDADKKRIIQKSIMTSQDFTGLHSRVVWGWLNQNKEHYWAVEQAKQAANSQELITFDQLSPDLQKQINDFKMSLMNGSIKEVPEVSEAELKKIETEDAQRVNPKSYAKDYKQQTEDIEQRQLHFEWIKANFHPLTREKLPGYIDEEEWIKQNKTL